MANKELYGRLVQKHDTEENWKKATNFTPKQAEIIVYDIDNTHDYERYKMGDGITKVNDLPFIGVTRGNELSTVEEGINTHAGCKGYYFDAV
jgi:hypothetical protein